MGTVLSSVPVGCSWWRFDDITEKPPVVLLNSPSGTRELGTSVAAIPGRDQSARVFAAGIDGFAIYNLGKTEPNSTDALDQATCERDRGCFMAEGVAAIHRTIDGNDMPCFAFGISSQNKTPRTQLYCDDGSTYGLNVDATTTSKLQSLSTNSTLGLKFASAPRNHPERLVATATSPSTLWYYPSTTANAVALPTPSGVGSSFGRSVALFDSQYDSKQLGATLLIGEPDNNRVFLMTVDEQGALVNTRCLEGPKGFGLALTSGYFLSNEVQGVAIAANDRVLFLGDLSSAAKEIETDKNCRALDDVKNVKTLGCRDFGVEVRCETALSLSSIAPVDLNNDGLDELVVGLPSAVSGGYRAAGQLLTVTFTADALKVHDRLSPSSIESGDRLGESIVAVPLSRPDVILAGAPGGNKLAAFYCSTLLPAGLGGKRCE
jgi:hypothetical protein